jgi:hypothetical protein
MWMISRVATDTRIELLIISFDPLSPSYISRAASGGVKLSCA